MKMDQTQPNFVYIIIWALSFCTYRLLPKNDFFHARSQYLTIPCVVKLKYVYSPKLHLLEYIILDTLHFKLGIVHFVHTYVCKYVYSGIFRLFMYLSAFRRGLT